MELKKNILLRKYINVFVKHNIYSLTSLTYWSLRLGFGCLINLSIMVLTPYPPQKSHFNRLSDFSRPIRIGSETDSENHAPNPEGFHSKVEGTLKTEKEKKNLSV